MNAGLPPILVMGDDIYMPVKAEKSLDDVTEISEILLDETGEIVNAPKTAKNMFLQKFSDETLPVGHYWTPFPRIVSKMF